MGRLFVVATPIGNMDDLSKRALEVLSSVDLILAEDTRVTQKILNSFSIDTPVRRYNEHRPEKIFNEVKSLFLENKSAALVSDSGTPGISDPGGRLVEFVQMSLPEVNVLAVPGPSAVAAALSVSGMPGNEFTFLGYPPAKNKRKKFFERVKNIETRPVVLYESPHRFLKTLNELKEEIGGEADVFVIREMTKIYEEHFRGTLEEAIRHFENGEVRGEFVIIIR